MPRTWLSLLHHVGTACLIVTVLSGSHAVGHLRNNINLTELGQEPALLKEKGDNFPYTAKLDREVPEFLKLLKYPHREEALKEHNKLHLKSPGFQFLFIDITEDDSSLAFRDATPSMSKIKNLEANALLDPDSDPVPEVGAKIVDDNDLGKHHIMTMTDMIDGMAITHEDYHQVVTKLRFQQEQQKKNLLHQPSFKDYVDLHRHLTPSSMVTSTNEVQEDHLHNNKELLTGTSRQTEAQPQVFVIFDYANTVRFNKNNTAIVDYLNVYFHGVNNRYGTVSEPRIAFKISGVLAVTSRKAQPFLEKHRLRGEGYDINLVLESFAGWIYGNLHRLPKHDLAHLITGEVMKTKDRNEKNKYVDDISGLAYLKGACWVSSEKKMSLATSIAQDIDGIWDGVFTSAHELAHNLGASHDGIGIASGCPWTEGFIMSYLGWGTRNKFFFSKCSIQAMKKFLGSREGACVRMKEYSPVSTYEVANTGERLDMTMLCKLYTKKSSAYVDPDLSPSELCKNLICRYPDDMNGYHLVKVNHPPGDNATCNLAGGRCWNGDCVSSMAGIVY